MLLLLLLRNWVAHTKTRWFYHFFVKCFTFSHSRHPTGPEQHMFLSRKHNRVQGLRENGDRSCAAPGSEHQRGHIYSKSGSLNEGLPDICPGLGRNWGLKQLWVILNQSGISTTRKCGAKCTAMENSKHCWYRCTFSNRRAPCRLLVSTSMRKAFTVSCKFSVMHVTWALTQHNQCAPNARQQRWSGCPPQMLRGFLMWSSHHLEYLLPLMTTKYHLCCQWPNLKSLTWVFLVVFTLMLLGKTHFLLTRLQIYITQRSLGTLRVEALSTSLRVRDARPQFLVKLSKLWNRLFTWFTEAPRTRSI